MRQPSKTETTVIAPTPSDGRDDSLTHWVKLAYLSMRKEMEASLRAQGLTLTQWKALGALLHRPGTTHSDLVRLLEVEAPSVTSLVNGMEKHGWVRQERSATDARVKRLFLTTQGRHTIRTARVACAPVESRMEAALPEDDRAELKRLLRMVIDGLQ